MAKTLFEPAANAGISTWDACIAPMTARGRHGEGALFQLLRVTVR